MNEFKEIIKDMPTEQKDKMLFDIYKTYMTGKKILSNEEKLEKMKSILTPISGNHIFK